MKSGCGMKKRSRILLLAVCAALLAAIVILVRLNNGGGAASGRLTVRYDNVTLAEYSPDDLALMEHTEQERTLTSQMLEVETGMFTVVELETLLKNAGVNGGVSVVIKAEDGYTVAFSEDEVSMVVVAYEKDGARMKCMEDGGDGPFRILTEDVFATRCARNAYLIEVTE